MDWRGYLRLFWSGFNWPTPSRTAFGDQYPSSGCPQKLRGRIAKPLVALRSGLGFEFAAFDLISASAALEQILGVITPDDLLERIFADFCIGK